jgi:ferric-dicitrate binding protein FerR (iron transport regulator)
MDSSQRLQELFDRYLRRETTSSEVQELVILLGQADAEQALSEPMRRLWEELKGQSVEYPVDWDKMYRQISQVEADLSTLQRRREGPPNRPTGFRIGWRHSEGHRAKQEAGMERRMAEGSGMAGGDSETRGRSMTGGGSESGGDGMADFDEPRRIDRLKHRVLMAVFLLLAGTAAYFSIRMGGGSDAHRAAVAAQPAVVTAPVAAATRATGHLAAEGKKRVVHLPDGSTVLLNRHSTLDYSQGIAGGREVTLSGEAYFDIVHRTGQPFLVHTGKIVTKVLGTAFNIKAYPGEHAIEVTVDHGKVQVLKGRSSIGLLTDNQQMRYNNDTEGYISREVNIKPVMAWKPEEVVFDDLTMEEAAKRIGQRFNVTVSFVNPVVKECRVTATFYQEDDLDQIMTVICGVSQSNFVIKGNTIVIDGKGCN